MVLFEKRCYKSFDLTESWTQTRQVRARAKRANLEVTIVMELIVVLVLVLVMFRRLLPSSELAVD